MLDLKVWIEVRRITDGEGKERDVTLVLREFYSKGLASKAVTNARSTLPWNCTRKYSRKNC